MAEKSNGEVETKRILRFPQVKALVSFSRMHVDRLEKAGSFPKRIRIGVNSVGWLESEVNAWVERKVAQREAVSPGAHEPEAAT
ncbi:AlpA family transcriptional regulator [Azospirillum brasilense]|nr:AlpA family transcriptional regulator [Azospirillum brasilense]